MFADPVEFFQDAPLQLPISTNASPLQTELALYLQSLYFAQQPFHFTRRASTLHATLLYMWNFYFKLGVSTLHAELLLDMQSYITRGVSTLHSVLLLYMGTTLDAELIIYI